MSFIENVRGADIIGSVDKTLLLHCNNISGHYFFVFCPGISRGTENSYIGKTYRPELILESTAFLGPCNSGKPVVKPANLF